MWTCLIIICKYFICKFDAGKTKPEDVLKPVGFETGQLTQQNKAKLSDL